MAPDVPSATLAGIREDVEETVAVYDLDGAGKNSYPVSAAMSRHALVLLVAVEAALKDHRKSMFPAGPPGAGDAYGKHYCAGICYTSIDDQVIYRVWPCQPYQDIIAALAGKESADA